MGEDVVGAPEKQKDKDSIGHKIPSVDYTTNAQITGMCSISILASEPVEEDRDADARSGTSVDPEHRWQAPRQQINTPS